MRVPTLIKALLPASALLTGCLVAAAGAGAGGAIYVSERDAEATILSPVSQAEAAAKRAFGEMGIKETKTSSEQEAGGEKRVLEGTLDDREITVAIQTAGTGSKVVVAAKKSPVTWDKDLAKRILEKIVEGTK